MHTPPTWAYREPEGCSTINFAKIYCVLHANAIYLIAHAPVVRFAPARPIIGVGTGGAGGHVPPLIFEDGGTGGHQIHRARLRLVANAHAGANAEGCGNSPTHAQ